MNTRNIRFFDMFAGIGGFRAGLERAGGFTCIGHSEIDKFAHRAYQNIYNMMLGSKAQLPNIENLIFYSK